jgi:hypothetical protein
MVVLNLFKAYLQIEDVEFKMYVLYMQFGYTAAPAGFNACTLMESVEKAYKQRVEASTWKPMLEGMVDEEIAALKAMVEANNAEITALKPSSQVTVVETKIWHPNDLHEQQSKRGKRYHQLKVNRTHTQCLKIENSFGLPSIKLG